jgi:hypothetical protein
MKILNADYLFKRKPPPVLNRPINPIPTRREVYELGVIRGERIASKQPVLKIGTEVPVLAAACGISVIRTIKHAEMVFIEICFNIEDINRDSSEFKIIFDRFNNAKEHVDFPIWVVYSDGIYKGFQNIWNVKKHKV